MNDTERAVLKKWQESFEALTPQDRLKMACSMFEFSRELVAESIRNEEPTISESELRKRVFIRFYGNDFDSATVSRIIRHFE